MHFTSPVSTTKETESGTGATAPLQDSNIVHFTFYINAPQTLHRKKPSAKLVGISIARDSSRKRRGEGG